MATCAAIWSFTLFFMASSSSLALSSSPLHVQYSAISAAPAFLPTAPLPSSPSLSPDIEPLLPTPKGMAPAPAPADSLFPTIPSSPSPPDPDSVLAPGPAFALAPSGSLPVSTSVSSTSDGALKKTLLLGLVVALCLLQ
ncbi:hypothetical protein V6N13_146828 [Hibiscus sabdariffa]|uniref:Classical arabinogalactan protein 26-like n=1 Tax=Hibiscus sabdariffa TaxID=183260 RepID=A0ABR2TU28_9ROSI